jgi:acetoin utilization deacetylase AcuC-like enzyme
MSNAITPFESIRRSNLAGSGRSNSGLVKSGHGNQRFQLQTAGQRKEDSKRFSIINRLRHSRRDAQDANPHKQTARHLGAGRWMGHVPQYGAGRLRLMVKIVAVTFLSLFSLAAVAVASTMAAGMKNEKSTGPTAFVYDPVFLEHETGPGFPESPNRLRWLTAHLESLALSARLLRITPDEGLDPVPWIAEFHDKDYIEALREACRNGEKFLGRSPDSPISERSWDAAVRAVGAALSAVDAVMDGRARNAFAAVRPPGHHAMPDSAKGFCLFGNAAIAARYAQKKHGIERVMIIDWDVHHGDGTQKMTYDDPTIFCFSTHQYPFYPGSSGAADNTGEGKGKGFNLNVPLAAGGGDQAALSAFRNELTQAFRKFRPQFVIISAGFDAHEDDPLGGLGWTSAVYGQLTGIVRELCREQGHERIVSVLEGGYSKRGMTEGVAAHLEALSE